jgi:hypothetical protein
MKLNPDLELPHEDIFGGSNKRHHDDRLSGKVSWDLSDSFHLRLLIHFVGDIH